MTASGPASSPSIGFFTVKQFPDLGLIGGYLVLNSAGRPLEFHCTAPVRANRTQEILYGPTLTPYLYGEQIGQTLLGKGRSKPLFICTDVEPALSVRDFLATPVIVVHRDDEPGNAEDVTRQACCSSDSETVPGFQLHGFQVGGYQAAVPANRQEDAASVSNFWRRHVEDLDLLEPFNRLHEAIDEAQRGAARSPAA